MDRKVYLEMMRKCAMLDRGIFGICVYVPDEQGSLEGNRVLPGSLHAGIQAGWNSGAHLPVA